MGEPKQKQVGVTLDHDRNVGQNNWDPIRSEQHRGQGETVSEQMFDAASQSKDNKDFRLIQIQTQRR